MTMMTHCTAVQPHTCGPSKEVEHFTPGAQPLGLMCVADESRKTTAHHTWRCQSGTPVITHAHICAAASAIKLPHKTIPDPSQECFRSWQKQPASTLLPQLLELLHHCSTTMTFFTDFFTSSTDHAKHCASTPCNCQEQGGKVACMRSR